MMKTSSAGLKKRSPFRRKALHEPGQSIRKHINEIVDETIFPWIACGALLVVLTLLEWARYLLETPPMPKLATFICIAFGVCFFVQWRKKNRELRSLLLGYDGEKAVAEALEDLKSGGFHVIHDIPGDSFNVDHVVVGPTGVFVIETKARSNDEGPGARVDYDGQTIRVAGFVPDRDPIKQVRALSDFVRKLIKDKLGLEVQIQRVVVFPGWFVNEPRPTPEVWVLNETRLLGYIRNERNELSPERILTVSSVLKDHVRTWQA